MMRWKWTIRRSLLGAVAVVVLIQLVTAAITWRAGRNLERSLDQIARHAVAQGTSAEGTTAAGLRQELERARKQVHSEITVTCLLVLVSVIAAVLFGYILTRWIEGSLHRAFQQITQGIDQVYKAARQVAAAAQDVARGASQQASAVQRVSANSEQLNSMTQQNAHHARSAAETVAEASKMVEAANRTLAAMVQSMREINEASDRISRVIKVIDELAFQTNILALNAAVEAARAGEAGLGFAVVADEVRNLAQRSAQAAQDTAAMIQESIQKSAEGAKRLEEVQKAIAAITETSSKINVLVSEVSTGSEEQAQGIRDVAGQLAEMEKVIQQAAASAEESASAAEELTAQAAAMRTVVEQLYCLLGGRQVSLPEGGPEPATWAGRGESSGEWEPASAGQAFH